MGEFCPRFALLTDCPFWIFPNLVQHTPPEISIKNLVWFKKTSVREILSVRNGLSLFCLGCTLILDSPLHDHHPPPPPTGKELGHQKILTGNTFGPQKFLPERNLAPKYHYRTSCQAGDF